MPVGYTPYLSTSLNAAHLGTLRPLRHSHPRPCCAVGDVTQRMKGDTGRRRLLGAGCEQPPRPAVPHVRLPARSRGRRSAASYSHKLQPSELQKTKISIGLILIFLAVDFGSSAAQGHAGREETRSGELSSSHGTSLSPALSPSEGELGPKFSLELLFRQV